MNTYKNTHTHSKTKRNKTNCIERVKELRKRVDKYILEFWRKAHKINRLFDMACVSYFSHPNWGFGTRELNETCLNYRKYIDIRHRGGDGGGRWCMILTSIATSTSAPTMAK